MSHHTLLSTAKTLRHAQRLVGSRPGEYFNIFQVLGMETSEVGTHSQLLAELLNPKGSHGLSEVFLRLWLEQLGVEDFDSITFTKFQPCP